MFNESFDLVVGSGHALAMLNSVDLDVELIREEQFLLLSGADLTEYERERLGTVGVNLVNAHEVDLSHDMETMVAAGFGIAVAPNHALRSAQLHRLNLAGLDVERTVAVYTVAGRPKSRETSALLNLLRGKQWG